MNPYDPPDVVANAGGDRLESPTVHPAVRIFAGIMMFSGAGFVPIALLPLMVPGLFIWAGWLLIAAGRRPVDTLLFWWLSLGWNVFTFWFLIVLRGGNFGPIQLGMAWVWMHLLTAVLGSAIVLLFKYGATPVESVSQSK